MTKVSTGSSPNKNAIFIDGGKYFLFIELLKVLIKLPNENLPWKRFIFLFFFQKGIHAREWISPAVVTWIMSELIENNTAHPEMTNNLDWYFVTNVNPDGYEYSHTTV